MLAAVAATSHVHASPGATGLLSPVSQDHVFSASPQLTLLCLFQRVLILYCRFALSQKKGDFSPKTILFFEIILVYVAMLIIFGPRPLWELTQHSW